MEKKKITMRENIVEGGKRKEKERRRERKMDGNEKRRVGRKWGDDPIFKLGLLSPFMS